MSPGRGHDITDKTKQVYTVASTTRGICTFFFSFCMMQREKNLMHRLKPFFPDGMNNWLHQNEYQLNHPGFFSQQYNQYHFFGSTYKY